MNFQLTQTKVKVEGESEAIIFSNLVINQYLADVNSFTFTWRQEEGKATLSDHVNFYQKNLSKSVVIDIGDSFTFKGIIYAINCNNQDSLGVSYDIIGKGMFVKMDEVPECNSFVKKNLSEIFKAINTTSQTSIKASPNNTSPLFYTVQYNQTNFDFIRMLAARHGEWLYYNGTEMVLGEPAGTAEKLVQEEDVFDVDITAKIVKAPQKNAGFDHYKGEKLNGQQTNSTGGSSLMAASKKAGENAFGNSQATTHVSNAANAQVLKEISTLKHQAAAASSVVISARSYNPKLKLGGKIKLTDTSGGDAGQYVITEIQHRAMTGDNYQNQFVAIPAENKVPPYTDPGLFAICKPQPAVVIDNEDKDGLDRVKVRFPWQPDDQTTPWLSVLTPHAGKDKGIRFLPEINEEVLVAFVDNNAEKPFVMGAVHTEKNKSGNAHGKNNLKIIGSKTGRRFEIDDDKGDLRMADNYLNSDPQNVIKMHRKDADTTLFVSSLVDNNNGSTMILTKDESIIIKLINGGTEVTEIKLEKSGKKITINSKGSIDIKATGDLNLSGANVNIKAQQELLLEGKAKGVTMKGMKMALTADTTLEAKGLTTTVEGSAKMDLKGGAMASLTGIIVKIN